MPADVAQQAQAAQNQATYQQNYQDCITNNSGQTTYCQCIANGGIGLNTDVPFIGRCINKTTSNGTGVNTSSVFGYLIAGLSKIVVTAILIVSFVMIIIGGVMWTTGGDNVWKWKKLITKVIVGMALLGAAWAILHLINPNFFI